MFVLDSELTSPFHSLVMLRVKLGSDKYKFGKSSIWNCRPSTWEAYTLRNLATAPSELCVKLV